MSSQIHLFSEISPLKLALLKRPGAEIDSLTPDYLEQLLFDDIPFLPGAQAEHDFFVQLLRDNGVEVLYLDDLMTEAIGTDPEVRESFVAEVLAESGATVGGYEKLVHDYLLSLDDRALVEAIMTGIRKKDIESHETKGLQDLMDRRYPYYLDPLPNLYFTRDPAAAIGGGVTLNRMFSEARQREPLFFATILKHHPRFAGEDIPIWRDRDVPYYNEGGDIALLSDDVIAVGVSQRTTASAIEDLARRLFARQERFCRILAFEIPESRAFMHLDTVFSMVDVNQFAIHPAILDHAGEMNLYLVEADEKAPRGLRFTATTDLHGTLKRELREDTVDFIPTGGGDLAAAAREQWSDAANLLALSPGVVVSLDRNVESNEELRRHGVRVLEIPGSEISRGRGGPRCMTMPLVRD
ncbi:MAG: arginine deiminase [Actinomycetia bacterium]|nr:arginine deiminase [Actinomycetes bacterium]